MAGNDSVNSYLEAILDVGPPMQSVASAEGEKAFQSYSKEVIAGFGETDLHRSWIRAAAMRSPQERNTRLEDLDFGPKEEAGN